MKAEYLTGVNLQESFFDGLGTIEIGRDTWYIGRYDYVTNNIFASTKHQIVADINKIYKKDTKPGEWEWHHIVEDKHVKTILSKNDAKKTYDYKMPTILLHNGIHQAHFTTPFELKQFKELAQLETCSKDYYPKAEFTDKKGISILKKRIYRLRHLYNDVYDDYPALQKIANNFFDYQSRKLDRVLREFK